MKPFVMERWQSHYENTVRYNLSDSGVHPLSLRELLTLAGEEEPALETALSYGQTNGSEALRRRIAALYDGADPDRVVVTNGSAEANFLAAWHVVRPGDAVAVLTPTYMQLPGLADGFGAEVRHVPLREENGWQVDPSEASRLIDEGTRLVVVTNPQNPTGVRLSETSVAAVLGAAERVGAWVLADEVYRGAEREGPETPSLFGRYERVLATASLSKAYGLQGLRIGWLVAPDSELAEELWGRKDYTTIAPGHLTDTLAALALRDDIRPRLIERARRIVREGYDTVARWVEDAETFRLPSHEAGAVCFPSYALPIESGALAERLRAEQDVLVVPGSHFGLGKYLRLGLGVPQVELEPALRRVGDLVRTL
ncbi:MAG: aminotransferase class I/II-fold pyridoxal phosphate-dependent enzyme [Longimicrobiales bacterium]|nr:aminotransferase class I/II-fold pyridoxal phosphate-dependent enzyme [Longimicrobiales bacterium]